MLSIKHIYIKTISSVCHYSGLTNYISRYATQTWKILNYTHVIDPKDLSYPLESETYVKPSIFRKQMQYVSTHCKVISLEELTHKLSHNEHIHPKTIVITFNEGRLDIYKNAYPTLKALNIPATVFLPTSYIGTQDIFWTDKIARAFALIRSNEQKAQFNAYLDEIGNAKDLLILETLRALISPKFNKNESKIFVKVLSILKSYTPSQRDIIITLIDQYLDNTKEPSERSFINWEEVKEMLKNNITFGHLGYSHKPFSELSTQDIEGELNKSIDIFEHHQITPSKVFCFQEGVFPKENALNLALTQKGFTHSLVDNLTVNTLTVVNSISNSNISPILLGRTCIYDNISYTIPLFTARLWL